MKPRRPAALGLLVAFACSSSFLTAQCEPVAGPGPAAPGPIGMVLALATLPNGDLVAGGDFTLADTAFANRVAHYDGTAWRALGDGVDGTVRAIAVAPNGDVFVGGDFTTAGGVAANRVARWDGAAWSPLGQGIGGRVEALLALPNGELIAGGQFTTAGGVAAQRIARWDGAAWSPLGAGVNGPVYALGLLPNGDVLVGGQFAQAGGLPAVSLATWDGAAWTAVPGLTHPSYVFDAQVLAGGTFAIAGLLSFGAAVDSVALWNGTQVVPLGLGGLYNEVGVLANGQLVAGGYAPGATIGTVATWNGTTWTPIGAGAPFRTFAFQLAANGDLIAGGMRFDTHPAAGGAVARYDGSGWTNVGAPEPPRIDAIVPLPDGDLVVGGDFATIDGVAAQNVARFDGAGYAALGLGVDGPVRAMCVTDGGTLVVGGDFASAGGGPANRIARWNGATWSTLGTGLPDVPRALAANDAGEVLALTGSTAAATLWRFDGLGWSTLPATGTLLALGSAPGGTFVIGGLFSTPGGLTGCLALSGTTFTPLSIPGPVLRFGRDADGAVLASGAAGPSQVHRLQNGTFTQLGTAVAPGLAIDALASLPDGDVLAFGRTPDLAIVLMRFDGGAWSQFGPVVRQAGATPTVGAVGRRGDILIGGAPVTVAGNVSVGRVRLSAPCAPTAIPIGTGCSGAAGPVSLATDDLPWLGSTFRATATGLTTPALAVHVIGSQSALAPLPGAPGCSLYEVPELLDLLLPSGGQVAAALALPTTPSLTGLMLRTQVVALELDPLGGIVRLTSSNALALTLGRL